MFVHTVIMVIEPHMKQGRQHKLISTIFLATSVTKKLDTNKPGFYGFGGCVRSGTYWLTPREYAGLPGYKNSYVFLMTGLRVTFLLQVHI